MRTDDSAGPATDAETALWPACLDILAQELPEQQFNTWIRPLSAQLAPDQSRLTLWVGNRFKLDWVRAQYAARIAAVLESLHGQPVQVELALAPRANPAKPVSYEVRAQAAATFTPTAEEPAPPPADVGDEAAGGQFRNRLNTGLTFDTLVDGSANRMARAAALHVADYTIPIYFFTQKNT